MTVYDNIWAFPAGKIGEYFISLGMKSGEDGSFLSEGCSILVYGMNERPLGNLMIPQTRVIFRGVDAEHVFNAFKLHFLSGGA